jgi:hypothetical protein
MNEGKFIPDFELEGADNRAQHSARRDLLEATKLSRLPERKPFSLDGISSHKQRLACVNCKTGLANETEFLQSIRACRKCLGVYVLVLQAIEAAEQRKRRETLERFVSTTGR